MDIHVKDKHNPNANEEVRFSCVKCSHDFEEVENYNTHLKTHDDVPCVEEEPKTDDINCIENMMYNNILEYFANIDHSSKWEQQGFDEKLNNIPLAPRGVLAPVSTHAGPSAQPPIGTSGNFPARVSAE